VLSCRARCELENDRCIYTTFISSIATSLAVAIVALACINKILYTYKETTETVRAVRHTAILAVPTKLCYYKQYDDGSQLLLIRQIKHRSIQLLSMHYT
jgi:hypothetical protein